MQVAPLLTALVCCSLARRGRESLICSCVFSTAGFDLVADDQVDIVGSLARPATALAGLLEVRGLGIIQIPYLPEVTLKLVISMGRAERLPQPGRYWGLPLVHIEAAAASAPSRVTVALRCVLGQVQSVAGAFE